MDIGQEILEIKERNKKVEADKAWETSWVRRMFITLVTYVVACLLLYFLSEHQWFAKALIPSGGYLLSTFSLPFLKKWWIRTRHK